MVFRMSCVAVIGTADAVLETPEGRPSLLHLLNGRGHGAILTFNSLKVIITSSKCRVRATIGITAKGSG